MMGSYREAYTTTYGSKQQGDAGIAPKCRELTTDIDFGLIESHTRPFKMLVTANPSVNRSALDCEL